MSSDSSTREEVADIRRQLERSSQASACVAGIFFGAIYGAMIGQALEKRDRAANERSAREHRVRYEQRQAQEELRLEMLCLADALSIPAEDLARRTADKREQLIEQSIAAYNRSRPNTAN